MKIVLTGWRATLNAAFKAHLKAFLDAQGGA